MESTEILKVSSTSRCSSLAGAIANTVRLQDRVELQAVGAGAVNQALKAIAIARGYLAPSGKNLICIPSFIDINLDEDTKTGLRIVVKSVDL